MREGASNKFQPRKTTKTLKKYLKRPKFFFSKKQLLRPLPTAGRGGNAQNKETKNRDQAKKTDVQNPQGQLIDRRCKSDRATERPKIGGLQRGWRLRPSLPSSGSTWSCLLFHEVRPQRRTPRQNPGSGGSARG